MKPIYLLICFGIVMLFFVPMVSADSLGVTHQYNSALRKYEIYQWFGLQPVADLHLISNTEQCLTDCEAVIKLEPHININTNTNLNDYDWQFLNVLKQEQSIDYKVLNLFNWTEIVEIPEYECQYIEVPTVNGTELVENCSIEGYIYEEVEHEEFREIDFYDYTFEAGREYILKLRGSKPLMSKIEWIPIFYSVTLDEWAWWNNDWTYKKEINITSVAGVTENNYTIDLKVPYVANMNSSYSDLRFVNGTEGTEYGYYIYFSNSTEARVYVKINDNLIAGGDLQMYMYYGNEEAATTSDIEECGVLGESGADFTGWTEVDESGTITLDTANNRLSYVNTPFRADNIAVRRPLPENITNFSIIYTNSITSATGAGGVGAVIGIADTDVISKQTASSAFWHLWFDASQKLSAQTFYNTALLYNESNGGFSLGAQYWNKITRAGTSVYFRQFNNSQMDIAGKTFHITYNAVTEEMNKAYMLTGEDDGASGETQTGWITNYSVMKYLDPAPSYAIGSEQQIRSVTTTLTIPADNTNTTTTLNNFTCNASSVTATLNNITLYIWNSSHQAIATNVTTVTGTFNETSWMVNLPYDDTYLWNCYAQDTTGEYTDWATNRTIRYDTTYPTVQVIRPTSYDISTSQSLEFNYTASDTHLGSCWYNLNNGSGNISLTTCPSNITINTGENNNFALDFYANDTFGHENSTSVDFTVVNLTINEVYPSSVIESSSQNFGITTQKNTSVSITSWLWFNNTRYSSPDTTTSGTNTTYNKTVTMPIAATDPETKTSVWSFNVTYGTNTENHNSTSRTVSISQMKINTGACVNTTVVLNYSFREELNNSQINGTSDLWIAFWSSSQLLNRTTNFTTVENNTFIICANGTYYSDAYLISTSHFKGKSYVSKSYRLLNATLNTSSATYDYLYMLPSSDSTSILLEILDEGYMPLEEHYVKVQRYYPAENIWRVVEILKTDENGYAIAHLEEEDADYRFIIQDYTDVLKTTSSMRIFCLESPCTLEIRVFDEEDPYEYLMPDNLWYNLSYTNATGIIEYSFTHASGTSKTATLTVYAKGAREDTLVCNTSTTASSGALQCDIGARSEDNYYTKAYWDGHFVKNMWVSIEQTFETFGDEGLIFMVIIMVTLAMVGIWNPTVSLVLMMGGFIFMLVTGIAYVVPSVIAAIAIIVIITIKYLNT